MTTNAASIPHPSRGHYVSQAQGAQDASSIFDTIPSLFSAFISENEHNLERTQVCIDRLKHLSIRLNTTSEKVEQLVRNILKYHSFHEKNCWTIYRAVSHQTVSFRKRNSRSEEVERKIDRFSKQEFVSLVCKKQLEKLESVSYLTSAEDFNQMYLNGSLGNSVCLSPEELKTKFSISSHFYQEEACEKFSSNYEIVN